jgi:hypothetical protein
MSKKKGTAKTPAADLPALKIGSRVRCTDDGVQGRITWANAASVKIEWDDGEKVTWKRDYLATRPIEVIDADQAAADDRVEAAIVQADGERETGNRDTPNDQPTAVPEANAASPETPASDATPAEQPTTETATATAKPKRQRKAATEPKAKKLSALDAAAKVLAEEGKPLNCQEMIEAMAAKGYWTSPGGKTPAATLYSAILRELSKGADSRFVKTERGRFARKS